MSFRSSAAAAYKRQVRLLAAPVFTEPFREAVEVRIDYFHSARRRVDVDNVAKCLLDALNGVAYRDDRQVVLASAKGWPLSDVLRLPGGPVDLIKPLREYAEYVFLRVREHMGSPPPRLGA